MAISYVELRKLEMVEYHFERTDEWMYYDHTQPDIGLSLGGHYLLLLEGQPRPAQSENKSLKLLTTMVLDPLCVLSYDTRAGSVVIDSIQRHKTSYYGTREAQRCRDFRQKIGMHPSELLVSKFIEDHREEVNENVSLYLEVAVKLGFNSFGVDMHNIYGPLISRFFETKPETPDKFYHHYKLSTRKKRVADILALEYRQK